MGSGAFANIRSSGDAGHAPAHYLGEIEDDWRPREQPARAFVEYAGDEIRRLLDWINPPLSDAELRHLLDRLRSPS